MMQIGKTKTQSWDDFDEFSENELIMQMCKKKKTGDDFDDFRWKWINNTDGFIFFERNTYGFMKYSLRFKL